MERNGDQGEHRKGGDGLLASLGREGAKQNQRIDARLLNPFRPHHLTAHFAVSDGLPVIMKPCVLIWPWCRIPERGRDSTTRPDSHSQWSMTGLSEVGAMWDEINRNSTQLMQGTREATTGGRLLPPDASSNQRVLQFWLQPNLTLASRWQPLR